MRGWRRKNLLWIVGFAAIVGLPMALHAFYQHMTSLPDRIAIATGPANGRFREVAEALAVEIETRLGVEVERVPSGGSIENLALLQAGKVDFALCQRGQFDHRPGEAEALSSRPAFVANLYSEVLLLIVRKGAKIETPVDLRGKVVSIGHHSSAEYALSRDVLRHFEIGEHEIEARHWNYSEIRNGFLHDRLDAALIAAGVHAPIIRQLFETGRCELRPIPHIAAFKLQHMEISEYVIPEGVYRAGRVSVPAADMPTLSLKAQLLTRTRQHAGLVTAVTEIVLSEDFQQQNQLGELFSEGTEFARETHFFPVHTGASSIYDPELRPLVNPDFVEATEGMRSFLVSVLIALYLLVRWFKEARTRRKEHRLDRYIRSLLDVERRQIALNATPHGDLEPKLQRLMDEVTRLRQDAFREFSAHDLNEDRAVDCFLEMCHEMRDMINARIVRHQFDTRYEDLVARLDSLAAALKARRE